MKLKFFLKMFLSSLTSIVLCGCALVGLTVYKLNANMTTSSNAQALLQQSDDSKEPEAPDTLPKDFYMLLLGVDSSENRESGDEAKLYGGAFRSDTIIVAHINTDEKQVSLCSLERDIKTDIDGHPGDYKLNAAYALGGVDLMKTEASELVGVDIPYYAVVDMDGMSEIIDSLGGVDVDVEDAFFDEQMQQGIAQKGIQTLNGADALVYCRSRHAWAEGDFARARHQRQVIQAIAKKVMSGADAWSLYNMANTLSTKITTNMPITQLFELAMKMRGLDTDNSIHSMMTPTVSLPIDGVSYQQLDETKWKDVLKDFMNNDGGASRTAVNNTVSTNAASSNSRGNEYIAEADKNGDGVVSDSEAADYAVRKGTATDVTNANNGKSTNSNAAVARPNY